MALDESQLNSAATPVIISGGRTLTSVIIQQWMTYNGPE